MYRTQKTILKTILLSGLTITLAGCLATPPKKPVKPTLKTVTQSNLVCFTPEDAVKLGTYIIELERGYE